MDTSIDRKKLFIQFASLVFLLFIVQIFATKFYWYYAIWYFDMPMHLLGGFCSGLFFIWLLSYKNINHESHIKLILQLILGVLFIGVFWEVFEFSANSFVASNLFLANVLDSVSDIFFDLAGGTIAILYFFKNIVLINKNNIQLP